MEVLGISLIFGAIVLGGCLLACLLIARALGRDRRSETTAESPPAGESQPAWVGPSESPGGLA